MTEPTELRHAPDCPCAWCRVERENDAGQTLAKMNDLYSLELSQAFAQAIEAGMLRPILEMPTGRQRFDITFCPYHQMVVLPTCPGCENPTA